MSEKHELSEAKWSVSLLQLTLFIVYVLVGAASAEIVRNISGAEKLSFTTTELIGFVLSVVLSAASIVLAIAAIWMGKVSELSVIRRSDESIRLQNEVFVRTTEALQRIEASTGVTEKRIEDIIQGRVGAISHKIAELAAGGPGLMRDKESLEEQIRASILDGVRSGRKGEPHEKLFNEFEARRKRYKVFHQAMLTAFSNKNNIVTKKLGDGQFQGVGEDIFDVVVEMGELRIGASAFAKRTIDGDFSSYLEKVVRALINNVVAHVFLFVDSKPEEQSTIHKLVSETLSAFKGDPQNHITVLCGDIPDIEAAIQAIDTSTLRSSEPIPAAS